MPPPEPFLVFTRALNQLGIRYMVSGGVAAIFYGEPRLTNDIDIVVTLTRRDIDGIARAFSLDSFYCPPTEILEAELGQGQTGHFNLIDKATGFPKNDESGGPGTL